MTEIFASNVLCHAALLEGLVTSGQLTRTAVSLGSEAARGFPQLGMKQRPALPTSSGQDFAGIMTGRDFAGKEFNSALASGEKKCVAALWMAAQARNHPQLRLLTISPGNTEETELRSAMPTPVRILTQRVMMPIVAPLFGLAHSLETGAERIVSGLIEPSFQSGIFYASVKKKLTGPVMDQSQIFPDLANSTYEQNADEALHTFLQVV